MSGTGTFRTITYGLTHQGEQGFSAVSFCTQLQHAMLQRRQCRMLTNLALTTCCSPQHHDEPQVRACCWACP